MGDILLLTDYSEVYEQMGMGEIGFELYRAGIKWSDRREIWV